MSEEIKRRFYDITNLIQQEFDRNLHKYGNKIQCRKGCSQCCSQIFNITPVDGFIIKEHIRSLLPERQRVLKEKARDYQSKKSELNEGGQKAFEGTTDEFSIKPAIPCPALGEGGECTIYEARPVICRRFGMPIFDYKNPGKLYACELNFKDGEEIIDEQLVPNQTAIGLKWDEVKDEFNSVHGEDGLVSTTVAEAILTA